MITKGIRGAITVEKNTPKALREATLDLLGNMFIMNGIVPDNISHIIFTTTKDLDAEFPAKFARQDMGLKNTAMMCFHELDVPNSLEMCLRVLIVLNCNPSFVPQFVYLKGAEKLRG